MTVNDPLNSHCVHVFYDPSELFVQLIGSCRDAPFGNELRRCRQSSDFWQDPRKKERERERYRGDSIFMINKLCSFNTSRTDACRLPAWRYVYPYLRHSDPKNVLFSLFCTSRSISTQNSPFMPMARKINSLARRNSSVLLSLSLSLLPACEDDAFQRSLSSYCFFVALEYKRLDHWRDGRKQKQHQARKQKRTFASESYVSSVHADSGRYGEARRRQDMIQWECFQATLMYVLIYIHRLAVQSLFIQDDLSQTCRAAFFSHVPQCQSARSIC